MRKDRARAFILRKKGYSYNEISRQLDIPKSTLSTWFSQMVLSETAQKRLRERVRIGVFNGLVRRNKLQTHIAHQRAKVIRQHARKSVSTLKLPEREALFLAGTLLYWGEGYKRLVVKNGKERTYHIIGLTNSDPSIVKVFTQFLLEIMEIPLYKIKINLRIYAHIDPKKAIAYWSEITNVSKENFDKPSLVVSGASRGLRPYKRLPYGTVQIRVNDTKKFHELMGWIEGLEDLYRI